MSRARLVDTENLGDSSLGFYRVWVTHLGRRFGLLQELAEGEAQLTPAALAAKRACHAPAVAAWCEAAHALGLLERNRGRYSVPPRFQAILADEAHASYLAGQFSYLALRSLDYDGFDGLFRRGVAPRGMPAHMIQASAEATRWDHTAFLEIAVPRLPQVNALLARGARVLDVGSGSGEWDIRMARRFPRASFLGIEPNPDALRGARRNAARARLTGRVRFVRGTGETMAFRQEFDLAYLGEALTAVPSKKRVLRRCHQALRSDGRVIVAEGLLDRKADPRAPPNPLLYGIELDFALQGTRLMTRPELRSVFKDCGFQPPKFLHAGGGLWFVVAAK